MILLKFKIICWHTTNILLLALILFHHFLHNIFNCFSSIPWLFFNKLVVWFLLSGFPGVEASGNWKTFLLQRDEGFPLSDEIRGQGDTTLPWQDQRSQPSTYPGVCARTPTWLLPSVQPSLLPAHRHQLRLALAPILFTASAYLFLWISSLYLFASLLNLFLSLTFDYSY